MENRILVVVDMQNDFVGGSLGSEAAQDITLNVLKKVANFPGRGNWPPFSAHSG